MTDDVCSLICLNSREFLFQVSPAKRRATNYNCSLKVDVKSDRSEPLMLVKFGEYI